MAKKVLSKTKELINDSKFYVLNQFAQFFCGFKNGTFYWDDKIEDARVFERHEQFLFICYHEPHQKAEKIYLI